jgi:hypothetical protein
MRGLDCFLRRYVIRVAGYNAIPVVKALPQRQAINEGGKSNAPALGTIVYFCRRANARGGHIFSGPYLLATHVADREKGVSSFA